ncbi:hypothetical protein TanjilG_13897 [Lupinus angustifolius]|uniref:PHD-type domain-containing protein n=2 Tax=Lupinus angustifolius TaxID=3871 RepID=A0A1J7HVJ2_LUPAN|nr:hypothetical protein TanjilG_13897 [Lupinus angustifolius]
MKKPCAVGNTSKDYSHEHWGNETFKIDKDDQEFSSQSEQLSHRSQNETNGHDIMRSGCSSEPDARGGTERCHSVLCNILTSENSSSLCKMLLENFQGIKPQHIFDFSVINTRMKEQAYEHSPTLFLSDIEQVWRKLQDAGNEIVSITKSLSDMSRASYCEKMKSKGHCGKKADGMDCLVCDSCEEMYHMPCIEPAVKEIPYKSWFCANCSGKGIKSQHENCVVCERLNVSKTLNNIASEETIPTNEETLTELEENSNCSLDDGIQVSIGGTNSPDCKICGDEVDGDKVKICGHPFCPSKYYHVRCLSSKLMKLYAQCWYCPFCLCQVCLTDQDDDEIVLCDSCDHAYFIYCMKPLRTSVPEGKWFCRKCNAGIQAIRRAKKAYESKKWRTDVNVSKPNNENVKKWNNKRGRESDKARGMDMLLTAASTLNFEENLTTTQIESQRT